MRGSALVALGSCVLLAGCHSRYIQTTVTNSSGAVLHVVQVDYPSASFGTQELAAGATFPYRFKVLGSGAVKVTFTDAHMQEHMQTGPVLHEGDEGALHVDFPAQDRAAFTVSVHP